MLYSFLFISSPISYLIIPTQVTLLFFFLNPLTAASVYMRVEPPASA